MKSFKFSLEKVLEHRVNEEKKALAQVVKVETQLQQAQKQITIWREEIDQTNNEAINTLQVSIQDRLDAQYYIHQLNEKILSQMDQVIGLENQLYSKRQLLMRATIQKETLEKLKKNRYQEWAQEQNTLENNFLDELGTMRFQMQKDMRNESK